MIIIATMTVERETSIIIQTPSPRTRVSLADDIRCLGVQAGSTVLVHTSLSAVGWVVGGAQSVVQALLDVVGPLGTLIMPAFSPQISDPSEWEGPEIPNGWFEEVRTHMPTFEQALTPTSMGQIAEAFRTWPGALRSDHPQDSFCALGNGAKIILAHQPLDWSLGNDSPMARMYEMDCKILLLGVGYESNSSLHFAECRSSYGRQQIRRYPFRQGGVMIWREVSGVGFDYGRFFPAVGEEFEKTGRVKVGLVGSAESRLMTMQALVDFAVPWFNNALSTSARDDGDDEKGTGA